MLLKDLLRTFSRIIRDDGGPKGPSRARATVVKSQSAKTIGPPKSPSEARGGPTRSLQLYRLPRDKDRLGHEAATPSSL
jgi:hypothetical protein